MGSIFADRMFAVHKSFIREILKVTDDPEIISFAGGLPNPRLFPVRELSEAAKKVLDEYGPSVLQYSITEGHLPLREYVSRRYAKRGVNVSPEEILIINGSQQGLDLAGKIFLNKGDEVLVERPTYLAALQSFGMYEPVFNSVTLEEDGPDLRSLEDALKGKASKIFYTVPNFQNPTGISYSREKRQGVADLLTGKDTFFIEDDPYGELRFKGQDEPSMKNFLGDKAILLGSFSKIVSPGVRLGWICAQEEIMEKLIVVKQASDLHSGCLSQRVVYQFLMDNEIDDHITRIREAYGAQRDLMLKVIEETFPEGVKYTKPEGGMFLWVTLPAGFSSLELFHRAIEEKVAFVPGQAFFADGSGGNTMRLNFSNSDPERIVEGITRLSKSVKAMMA
jgi:2-aminoadipate transaminase